MKSIDERVEVIERNYFWLRVFIASVIVVVAAVAWRRNAMMPDLLVSKGVIIKDDSGAVRAHIGYAGKTTFLSLYGADGVGQLQVVLAEKERSVTIHDVTQTTQLALGGNEKGGFIMMQRGGEIVSVEACPVPK